MKFNFILTLFLVLGISISSCKSQQQTQSANSPNLARYGIEESGGVPQGLQLGDSAPNVLLHVADSNIYLHDLLQSGPVVLMFYRGYWCPVCSRYMKNIDDSLSILHNKGITTLAVAPEMEKFVEETKEQTKTSLTLISDTSYTIIDAFKVRFSTTERYQTKIQLGLLKSIEATNNGSADLPVPASYLIDKNGKIVYRHFDLDYHNRASIKEINLAVDRMQANR